MARKKTGTARKRGGKKKVDARKARIRDLAPRKGDVAGGGFQGGFSGGFGAASKTTS